MGIRPAVVALIIAPVISSAKAAKLKLQTVWIPFVVALMISLDMGTVSSPILYIVLGGLGGFSTTVASPKKEAPLTVNTLYLILHTSYLTMQIYFQLIWAYLKIGIFGFGGGYAMLSLVQKIVVEPGWISETMFTDIVAISQMTPG